MVINPKESLTLLLAKNLKVRYLGENMEEYVILVDQNDNPIGKEDKVKCHLPNGKLHRAFTALIFNGDGKLLLTKRGDGKMLWPNDWDGTVASHPRESETYVSSAERRMPEEIGIGCKMNYVNKFEYHVPYKDIGSENEICGTLIGTVDSFDESSLIKDEISEIKWIDPDELKNELEENKDVYCPWMVIALYFLADSDSNTLEKFNSLITKWASDDLKRVYENAIKHYIPNNNWRLVT
uniref:isopentenyl-diphosphate Delta-isomerase n=1 Tax=uncultured marine thaumarchaeote AD1000_41_B03 TaxID=1455915 RepID=A0A075FW48_9ARCH|nr:isopentenyl-diphosphate delta-isomerase (idi, IDI) [uncultured marine thaumarchaeote AD1000_41_B03]